MITNSATILLDHINQLKATAKESAAYAADEYARTDNPAAKAAYQERLRKVEAYDDIWRDVCKGLHAVEAEMKVICSK